jgi:mono/diheme cytochrome c family protein
MRFIKEPKSLEFRIKYLLGIVFLGLFSGQCLADGDYNKSSGQLHFMLQCQGCHKANGEGMLGTIPSLLDDGLAMLESKRGREFFIKVPGSSMSPLNNQLMS